MQRTSHFAYTSPEQDFSERSHFLRLNKGILLSGAAATLLLLSAPSTLAQFSSLRVKESTAHRLPVELVQREFQARFNYITGGNYVMWQPGQCGDPAPLFPPDGYYGDLDSDPEFATWVIGDIAVQFQGYYNPFYRIFDGNGHSIEPFDNNWGDPLYDGSVSWLNSSSIEGQFQPPAFFTSADFPLSGPGFDLTFVTSATYAKCLYTLKSYIEKLAYVAGPGGLTGIATNGLDRALWGCDNTNSCADAQACTLGQFGWNYDPYLAPEVPLGLMTTGGSSNDPDFPNFSAGIDVSRRRTMYSPSFVGGTAYFYLAITNWTGCSSAGSQYPTGVLPDGKYHWVETMGLDGINYAYGRQFANFMPSFEASCPSDENTCVGWQAVNNYIIFAPTFDTRADNVPPCVEPPSLNVANGGGSCGGCGLCSTPGSVNGQTGSLDIRISLGPDQYGKSAGYFLLHADTPTADLYTVNALRPVVASDVNWSTEPDWHSTPVTTPNVTAYVKTNTIGYTIYFTNIVTTHFVSSVTVTNNNGNTNQFIISEVIGPSGSPRTIQFNYTNTAPGTTNWVMVEGGGLRNEARTIVWTTPTNRTDTIIVSNASGTIATQTTEQYQVFPWGLTLTQRTLGTAGLAKTTTWTYYQASDGLYNIGQLKQVVEPSGRWERYQYDTNGRLTNLVTQFGDNAIATADSANRVTMIGYNDSSYIITNIQQLLGTEVARSWEIHSADANGIEQIKTIRATKVGAAINDTWNLTNIVWRATTNSTTGDNWTTVQEQHEDGTMTFYTRAINAGQKTIVVKTGAPNSGHTDIVDGTQTTTVLGQWGQVLSQTVQDIASGGLTIGQKNYTYTDDLNRSYAVSYLDGTSETFNYACCGLDTQVDRDGVTTQYIYDSAKRRVGGTRLGITTTNLLDAAGQVLSTIRVGTDATQNQLSGATYGNDGSILYETNGLKGVTSHSLAYNPSGETVITDINPDGGTRSTTYYQDGTIYSVTGSAAHQAQYVYGIDSDGDYTREVKVTGGGGTTEWVKTSTDLAGRAWKTSYSDGACSVSYFNKAGQLTNQVDPDGLMMVYQYTPKGEQAYTAVDLNTNGSIDFGGTDRITFMTNDVVTDYSTTVRRSRTYVWSTPSSATSNLVSMTETSVDGLRTWHTRYRDANTPVVTQLRTAYTGGGNRYRTNTAPDGSYTVTAYSNGRIASVTRKDSGNNQIASTSYSYDPHGRQSAVTDARNGATTYGYNLADLVNSVTTPNPGTLGASPQTTLTYYNTMLQATNIVQPDGTSVYNAYLLTGELATNWGSRTYPVTYTYDYAGRMKTMLTWKNFALNSGAATTTWNYDPYRGFLTNKTYDGGAAGPTYTYTPAGRLKTRLWARNITTTYSYDNGGSLASTTYSDSTPSATYTYDRLGRQSTVVCNGMTDTLSYNTANQLLSEAYSGGTLAGQALTNAYDAYLRRTAGGLSNQPSTLVQYGYDNASRLQNLTNGTAKFTYSYLVNSPLVSQINFSNNGAWRMTTTKSYDYLNRLLSISSVPSAGSALSFAYTYNNANQRVRTTLADASYWVYTYDSLGQVISGHKFFADETPVAGQQFDYTFDNIGNRTQTLAGGDQNGSNQRLATYGANNLNQYTNRTVPGAVDVMGVSYATNAVTVAGQTAYRKGEYFRNQLTVNNSSAALWTNIVVGATGQTSVTGNVFVAQTPENYGYDADGNLTSDARWTYTWDAENRLTSMQGQSGIPTGAKYKLDFIYDPQGRRIQKLASTNNGSGYFAQNTNRFIYDGWNLAAALNPGSAISQSFAWGPDVSGTAQDAGGVGGLLEINDSANGVHFAAFDGNGNVAGLVKATDGTPSAAFEYGPFGETVRVTGLMGKANSVRFSTKYQDDESDLLYYGHRYLNGSTGRWLNRDPFRERGFELRQGRSFRAGGAVALLGERGDPNSWGLLRNNPVCDIDLLGLCGPRGCKCGRDITSSVYLTLQDIADTYASASQFTRLMARNSMFGPLSIASWDILYLFPYFDPVNPCEECRETLTFEGKCVRASELNYIMYGWAIQVSSYPRWLALFELEEALFYFGSDDDEAFARKVHFAEYGSDFSQPLSPAVEWPEDCAPIRQRLNEDIHHWVWWGLKPRVF